MFKRFQALFVNTTIAAFLFGSNSVIAAIYVMQEWFESGSIAGYTPATDGNGSFQIVSGGARAGGKFLRITKNKGARRY